MKYEMIYANSLVKEILQLGLRQINEWTRVNFKWLLLSCTVYSFYTNRLGIIMGNPVQRNENRDDAHTRYY